MYAGRGADWPAKTKQCQTAKVTSETSFKEADDGEGNAQYYTIAGNVLE
jgi:hypothetical protein